MVALVLWAIVTALNKGTMAITSNAEPTTTSVSVTPLCLVVVIVIVIVIIVVSVVVGVIVGVSVAAPASVLTGARFGGGTLDASDHAGGGDDTDRKGLISGRHIQERGILLLQGTERPELEFRPAR